MKGKYGKVIMYKGRKTYSSKRDAQMARRKGETCRKVKDPKGKTWYQNREY